MSQACTIMPQPLFGATGACYIEKGELITTGKAKSLYESNESDYLIMHYRDDTSAFDGKKIESLDGKGTINNKFNAFIMEYLEGEGIPTHFEKLISETDSLVKRLDMAPVECVVRNVAAGSICKRLGLEEGMDLNPPTFEFFYKDDDLGDPMINEYHIKSHLYLLMRFLGRRNYRYYKIFQLRIF